jgi:hypothetical protein
MRFGKNIMVAIASAAAAILLFGVTAFGCSRGEPFSFDELWAADVIVRATAVKYVKEPDRRIGITTGVPNTQVEFRVDEVLRGRRVPETLLINGYLSDEDDFNELEVPYKFVRMNGRSGSCFANTYRKGGQFLLFLEKTKEGYSPNISALGPTNEQVRGSEDPWVIWVRTELMKMKSQKRKS